MLQLMIIMKKKEKLDSEHTEKLNAQTQSENSLFNTYTYSQQYGDMHPGELNQMLTENKWQEERNAIQTWYDNELSIIDNEYEETIIRLRSEHNVN